MAATKRAAKGQGSIRQRGSKHQARRLNPTTGRTETRSFDTEEAARQWLLERQVDVARGVATDAAAGQRRLEAWWPVLKADADRRLKPSTRKYYREVWTLHVEPRWGRVQVGRISAAAVHTWVGELSDAGVALLGSGASRLLGTPPRSCGARPSHSREPVEASPPPDAPPTGRRAAPRPEPSEVAELVHHAHVVRDAQRDLGSPALAVLVQVLSLGVDYGSVRRRHSTGTTSTLTPGP